MYHKSQVAFIDTETTGLHPNLNPIWEIAIIADDVEHLWQVRLPDFAYNYISEWVLENTRFKDDYREDSALSLEDTADKLEELLKGRHLVGACPWFDSQRLHNIWMYCRPEDQFNHPWHYHLIDIECLTIGYFKGVYDDGCEMLLLGGPDLHLPMKHDDLMKELGVPENLAKHTAMGDARTVKVAFEKIFGEGE